MTFITQTLRALNSPDLVLNNVPCDPSVIVGDWVRFNSSEILIKAQADIFDNSNTIGLVEDLNVSNNTASVRVLGVSKAIFTGLDVTKEYFLSPTIAGEMSLSVPSDPGNIVLKVAQPFDSQRVLVLKSIRMQKS